MGVNSSRDEIAEISADIHVITAEINAYQRVAGEAIFEIGRRLKHVKENDLAHGEFGDWAESIGINRSEASRLIKVYDEVGGAKLSTYANFGLNALYLIATMPEAERTQPHNVPSTGETKTVDEMTVRELREVKKALKEAEAKAQQAEIARRDAEIKARQLARATEPIVKEIEVEHK